MKVYKTAAKQTEILRPQDCSDVITQYLCIYTCTNKWNWLM